MMTATEPVSVRRPMYVGLDAAARIVGVSRRTLERRIRAGELPTLNLGRRILVKPADLAELIEGRDAAAGEGRDAAAGGPTLADKINGGGRPGPDPPMPRPGYRPGRPAPSRPGG